MDSLPRRRPPQPLRFRVFAPVAGGADRGKRSADPGQRPDGPPAGDPPFFARPQQAVRPPSAWTPMVGACPVASAPGLCWRPFCC